MVVGFHKVTFPATILPQAYFVRIKRGPAHFDKSNEQVLLWIRGTLPGRFEIDLDELRQNNDTHLSSGPNVTLRDRKWQGAIRINRKWSQISSNAANSPAQYLYPNNYPP